MTKRALCKLAAAVAIASLLSVPARPTAAESVYIPLGSSGEIVIVKTESDKVVGKIDGLPAVHGLAATPDGRFLIAGSYEEREAGTSAMAKPAGVSEDEHAAHHGGSALPAQDSGAVVSTVSVIATADGEFVRFIDVPGAVHHVAVSSDGGRAVVTHPNQGTVSAIDLAANSVVATVATGHFPNYTVFAPDDSFVYVSNAGSGTISAVDVRDWAVDWTAKVGSSPEHIVLSADGARLYVNNVDDGAVSVVDVAKREAVRTIPIGATLHGIDLSDDGETLFVADLGDEKVVGVALASLAYHSVPLAPAPYHLATIPGTGKLYVSSADEPKTWVLDQKSLAVLGEVPVGGKGHQMVVVGPGR